MGREIPGGGLGQRPLGMGPWGHVGSCAPLPRQLWLLAPGKKGGPHSRRGTWSGVRGVDARQDQSWSCYLGWGTPDSHPRVPWVLAPHPARVQDTGGSHRSPTSLGETGFGLNHPGPMGQLCPPVVLSPGEERGTGSCPKAPGALFHPWRE